jgi:hypothetical protein
VDPYVAKNSHFVVEVRTRIKGNVLIREKSSDHGSEESVSCNGAETHPLVRRFEKTFRLPNNLLHLGPATVGKHKPFLDDFCCPQSHVCGRRAPDGSQHKAHRELVIANTCRDEPTQKGFSPWVCIKSLQLDDGDRPSSHAHTAEGFDRGGGGSHPAERARGRCSPARGGNEIFSRALHSAMRCSPLRVGK